MTDKTEHGNIQIIRRDTEGPRLRGDIAWRKQTHNGRETVKSRLSMMAHRMTNQHLCGYMEDADLKLWWLRAGENPAAISGLRIERRD